MSDDLTERYDGLEVDDGFGNIWERCMRPDCDLDVVRPGKVQCSGDTDAIGCPRGTPDTPTHRP